MTTRSNGATVPRAMFPKGETVDLRKGKKNNTPLWISLGVVGVGSIIGAIQGYKALTKDNVVPSDYPVSKIEAPAQNPANATPSNQPPMPGLKPYLDGVAWMDDEGWVYPNQVDRDGAGRPLYKLDKSPEDAFLAKMEANNAGDIDLYTRVSWRTCSGTKEGAVKRMKQIIDNNGIRVIEKYMIVDVKYEGDKAFVYYRQNGSEQVLMSPMMKINGEWQFS